jgi:hypothetical protein
VFLIRSSWAVSRVNCLKIADVSGTSCAPIVKVWCYECISHDWRSACKFALARRASFCGSRPAFYLYQDSYSSVVVWRSLWREDDSFSRKMKVSCTCSLYLNFFSLPSQLKK